MTGLMKRCPRCPAIGIVEQEEPETDDNGWVPPRSYRITWVGKDGRFWHDTAMGLDDLLNPSVGCGLDPALPEIRGEEGRGR